MHELFTCIDAWTRTALVLAAVLTYKLWKCVACATLIDPQCSWLTDIQLGSFVRMSKRN